MKEFYTRGEFCEMLGISSRTVTRWISNGTLRVVRPTAKGKFFVPASEVERFKIPGIKEPSAAPDQEESEANGNR